MQIRASSSAWRAAVGVVFAVSLLLAELHAQRRAPPPPAAPPQPVQQSARVKRGGSVEIPLRIYGTRNQQLDFLIRSQPESGTLSPPKLTGQQTATVKYTPPADLNVVRDKFSYAVRSTEGVSAPADVLITIIDAPPELIVPDVLQFPRLLVGERAEERLEIFNAGGGVAEGEAKVVAPWQIAGDAHYRLRATERRELRVVFAPATGGSHEGEVTYSSRPDRVTTVRGEALPPIGFEPERIDLKHSPSHPARAGAFELVNNLAEEQTITLHGSERLVFARHLTIPPGGRAQVVVQTDAGDLLAFEEEITAEARGVTARLRVRAPQVGPVVRVNPERVNFGTIALQSRGRSFLEFENIGGTAMTAPLAVNPPFSLADSVISLAPGEKKTIELGISATRPGEHQAFLEMKAPGQFIRIPITAKVTAPHVIAGNNTADRRLRVEAAARPVSLQSRGSAATPAETMPAGLMLGWVRSVTADSAQIEWRLNPDATGPFRAEVGKLSLQNTQLKIGWESYAGFKTHVEGDRIIGTFHGLAPGTVYRMRIVSAGAGRESPAPLFEVQFITAPKPPGFLRITTQRVLLTALALCLAVVVWKRLAARRSG